MAKERLICGLVTEVYSRVCGYFRPTKNWNKGKLQEFKERKMFDVGGSSQLPVKSSKQDGNENE